MKVTPWKGSCCAEFRVETESNVDVHIFFVPFDN